MIKPVDIIVVSYCGVLLLLFVILCVLGWHRDQNQNKQQAMGGNYEEKVRVRKGKGN